MLSSVVKHGLHVCLALFLAGHEGELLDVAEAGVGLGQLQVVLGRLPRHRVLVPQLVQLLLDNYFVMKPGIKLRQENISIIQGRVSHYLTQKMQLINCRSI